jgi:hypothetical protein
MKLKNIIVFLIIVLLGVVIGGLISENRANKVLLQNYEQESNIEKMQENINTENKALDEENLIFEKEVNVKKEEVSVKKEVVVETNPIISNDRGDIYVENNTIYVNGFEFDKPSELYVIDQNESGVIFGDENTRSTGYSKFGLGRILSPNDKCGNYFYDIEEGVIDKNLAYAEVEKREKTIMFSCVDNETIDGLELPSVSYQRTYMYTSPTFSHSKLLSEIISTMLTGYWEKQEYNRGPQQIADISNVFAEYMNRSHQMVFVDDNQLLFSGPNAGGSSPVFGLYAKDNRVVSSTSYNQLKIFNNFLNSCSDDFVSGYINNLNSEEPDLEDIKDDLACAGEITFKETEFGTH